MADRKLFVLAVVLVAGTGCTPNLGWVGDKTYSPPASAELQVEKLGIDDEVDILAPGAVPIVSHTITNTGTGAAPAGYTVNETVIQWVFIATTGSAGYVAGDPATHTVFTADAPGPALGPGGSQAISFGPITGLGCGLYQETLTVDQGNTVTESDEGNNQVQRFFFVPSTQQFNVTPAVINNQLFHADGRTNTHNFAVAPVGVPGPPFDCIFGHFSWVATEGSRADAMPVPPVRFPGCVGAIDMFVSPREHKIPPLGFQPTVNGKVTVLSEDGCVIHQSSGRVFIEHPTN